MTTIMKVIEGENLKIFKMPRDVIQRHEKFQSSRSNRS